MQMQPFLSALMTVSLLGALPGPAAPQWNPEGSPQGSKTGRKPKFVLEPGPHQLVDLIQSSALYLKRNYLFSETDIANAPSTARTLQTRLELDELGCEQVVSQIAYSMGFVMLPLNRRRGIYEWVYQGGPRRGDIFTHALPMTSDEVLQHQGAKLPVVTSVDLTHTNAIIAMNTLRPLFLNAMQIGAAGQRTLTLQGYSDQVATAVRLLYRIDVTPEERQADFKEWRESVETRLDRLEKRLPPKK